MPGGQRLAGLLLELHELPEPPRLELELVVRRRHLRDAGAHLLEQLDLLRVREVERCRRVFGRPTALDARAPRRNFRRRSI